MRPPFPLPRRLVRLLGAALLLVGPACRQAGPVVAAASPPPSPWSDAAGDVRHPALAALCVDLWEEMLASDPVWAGYMGDARFLHALPEVGDRAHAARGERLAALSRRAAEIDPAGLSPDERVTWGMALQELQRRTILHRARLHRWLVDPGGGPHVDLFRLAPDQPATTKEEQRALAARWAAMPAAVDARAAELEAGLRDGFVSSRHAIATSLAQLDRLLAQSVADWPLGQPALPGHDPEQEAALLASLHEGLARDLRPAFARLATLLRERLLPAARPDDQPGLLFVPGGEELYRELVQVHVGLPLDPVDIHETGLAEVARARAEIARLGQAVLGTSDVAEVQRRLRGDPGLHFETREQVEEAARAALARAQAALDGWFGLRPAAACDVVRIPPHEERDTTIAYYFPPAADGNRPGRYFVNTGEPHTRPRYDAEVLAFHEAVPGHHLQIAIAQELAGVPRFQREAGSTAFVEGWALYSERLADEMGLYGSDLDRLGVASFDAWRACRLVVDTGLHALGWTRQQAIDYLSANTLLAENNVVNEVDRYIAHPGQALAYKLGQLEIVRLRRKAERALGEAFDLADFHDVVLSAGAVSLPVLAERVEAWLPAARASG